MFTPQIKKTAILIFAHSGGEEIKHKPILQGKQLFDELNIQTLKTVQQAQLPYFLFSEQQQVGANFGERFTNAVQYLFDKGFEQVITVGNDTPLLKVSHILETEKQLQVKKLVLGPSKDGGFYLMGIHKSQFDAKAFLKLPWHTSTLFKELLSSVNIECNKVFQLQSLLDIDSIEDVKQLLSFASQLSKTLLFILLDLVDSNSQVHEHSSLIFHNIHTSRYYNKGSPAELRF